MSRDLAYVDSSALVKLFKTEDESDAISAAVTEWPALVSADLLDVEVMRVGRACGLQREAQAMIDAVGLVPMSDSIRQRAGRIGQPELRTLDAIHLATAQSLGERLGVVFAYDDRLIVGALLEGLPVVSPQAT